MTGEEIYQLRVRHGLSAERLGAMLGVSSRTIWNWEHYRSSPNPHYTIILEKIQRTLVVGKTAGWVPDELANTVFIVAAASELERNEQ